MTEIKILKLNWLTKKAVIKGLIEYKDWPLKFSLDEEEWCDGINYDVESIRKTLKEIKTEIQNFNEKMMVPELTETEKKAYVLEFVEDLVSPMDKINRHKKNIKEKIK